jgi:hypothetical protein
MGLINLQTDLKSLKFGKDRPGGGNSGQPFIQTPIPDNQSDPLPLLTNDTILRGGIQAPIRAAKDVARLTKYLFNPKASNGLLFIAKENLLSRTSPKTEASKGPAYAGGGLNAGVYSPLNTLAQAGVGNLGIRLNQKGIDPTGLSPLLSLNKYERVIKKQPLEDNRLVGLYTKIQENRSVSNFGFVKGLSLNVGNDIIQYSGGPGSILGVGKTRIRFSDQRTGEQNSIIKESGFFTEGFKVFKNPRSTKYNTSILLSNISTNIKYGLNNEGYFNIGDEIDELYLFNPSSTEGNLYDKQLSSQSETLKNNPRQVELKKDNLLKNISENPKYKSLDLKNDQYTNDKNDILAFDISSTSGSLVDKNESPTSKNSRKEQRDVKLDKNPILKNISENPDYNILNLDNTEYTTGKEDIITFDPRSTKGKLIDKIESSNSVKSRYNTRKADGKRYGFISEEYPGYTKPGTSSSKFVDKGDIVNSTPLYKSLSGEDYVNNLNRSTDNDDLIPFRIGIIDPNNPSGELVYMNFRSYIDSFSDSYSADWKAQSYMGRGEKFYKYGGFDRSISLAFTVVSRNEKEVGTVYSKLNYLASSLAPTYTPLGYMAGNICKMTVGDYIYEQYGFISSLTYDVPQEASWDIQDKLFTSELGGVENERLPYMIKVNGIKFTPIHNFRPEIAQIFTTDDNGNIIAQSTNPTQRYITNKISLG